MLEDGSEYIDFALGRGTIAPNGYLVIVTDGLAPAVNLSSLALVTEWEIGDKLAISAGGEMVTSSGAEADRIVVGKVAGAIDPETQTVPLFIDID